MSGLLCGANKREGTRGWDCQLEKGHEGRHRSFSGNRAWDDAAPPPPVTEAEADVVLLALTENTVAQLIDDLRHYADAGFAYVTPFEEKILISRIPLEEVFEPGLEPWSDYQARVTWRSRLIVEADLRERRKAEA